MRGKKANKKTKPKQNKRKSNYATQWNMNEISRLIMICSSQVGYFNQWVMIIYNQIINAKSLNNCKVSDMIL